MKRRELLAALAVHASANLTAAFALPRPSMAADLAYTDGDLAQALKLRELAGTDREAWKLVEALTTEVGARPAGSPADARAVAWALAAMKRLKLDNIRAEPVPLKVWQRGPAQARLLDPYPQPLVMAALGNSVATPAGGIEAELAWYPSIEALRNDTSDRAKGRIVFIDQKMERARDGSGYGPAVGARTTGAIEGGKRGALAVGIRSIGTDRDRIAHTGSMRYDLQVPRIPAFAVSAPDADLIARLHERGVVPRLALQMEARSGVEALTHNVIGEVKGTDLADEIVLISGHLDSWDLGQGAVDDGAGVAIALATAALIQAAGKPPRRTVRVVLWGNEENGFDGVRAYAERYGSVRHQWVGESDFGAGKVWQLRSRVRADALPLIAPMARLLAPLGVEVPAQAANEGTPGPDAGLLMRRFGWPAVELSQDGTNYFDVHHTENDTLDKIDPATLPQNVACWAVVTWLAAQAPLWFGPMAPAR